MRARSLAAVLCTAALLASLSAAALGAEGQEVTRASYREAVEPICQVNTEANERILGGVRAEVKAGRLKPAAAQFTRAATELKKTIGQLKPLPRPPADQARLSRWLGKVEAEAGLFEVLAAKLQAGRQADAERMVVKLTSAAAAANRIVIPFEFHYCLLEPGRFT
jgi:hypothetical protein